MSNAAQAVSISSATISSGGNCGSLLKYYNSPVTITYAQYTDNGVSYPAYCMDKSKPGISDTFSYNVTVANKVTDVQLWRIIINGYPYKTIEELGCESAQEAFSATKQAIYCYIHGNNVDAYSAIGTAGTRTLNALKQILRDANNSTETPISNTVKIVKENNDFDVDSIDSKCISKIYSIQAGTTISNYKLELQKIEKELPEGIKITDLNNNEKSEFSQNEKFKVLIPIMNLTQEANFGINLTTQIRNKAVLYGEAFDSTYQDYALTASVYEDATASTQDTYFKNNTKIKIIKQDEETKERLANVEFSILDENKQIVHTNLKTNENGEIEIKNIIPGKYYIKELSTKEGYLLNEELIEVGVELNQELTITINNLFEKKPVIEITKEKDISKKVVKKLPVTGM